MATIHDPRYRAVIRLLIQARRDASLTQAGLATLLAKPQSYIAKVENLDRRVDIVEVLDWVRVTGYPMEKFCSEMAAVFTADA